MTLLEAIAHAKGHNELNKAKRVAVVREVDGQRVSTVFDLASIRSGQEPDPEIFDDDVIVVEGAKTKRTLRDMLKGISLRDLFKPAGS